MENTDITISTYNKIAKLYTNKYFTDFFDKKFLDMFLKKLPDNAKILDIGCGPGQYSQYISTKGFSVEGIDLSDVMLQMARKKVQGLRFRKMDMRRMEFADRMFDGLLAAYSLIHIPSKEIPETLKEFNRVMKNGGYMLIIVQAGEADRVVDEPLLKKERIFVNFFTPGKLAHTLQEAGFTIVFQKEKQSKDIEGFSDRIIYTLALKNELKNE